MEAHVDCIGTFVFNLAVGKYDSSGVVNLHGGGQLGVTKFLEGDAYGAGLTGSHEGGVLLLP